VKGSWTREEDELIVAWVHENGTKEWGALAAQLPGRISKQCRERWHNHLCPSVKKTDWTEEEDKRLIELSQRYTKGKLAKAMGRSPSAVNNRRRVLGIEPFTDTTDMYHFAEIAEMVGIHHSTIKKVWVKNGFKYRKIGCRNYVTEKALLKYLQEHPKCYDARKADYYLFYRYKWFIDKLEQDRQKTLKTGAKWTDYEKSKAKFLKKRGLSYTKIAEELGRTRKAVIHFFSKYGE
jgi:predicted transcriptional regulator